MKKLFFLTALLCASVAMFAYNENEKFPANGTYANQFYWRSIDGFTAPMGVNSVEKKNDYDCIYVNVGQADFDRESGISGCEAITDDGAGVWIKISSLTKKRNIIIFKNAQGTILRGFVLFNESGTPDPTSEYCAYEGPETQSGEVYVTLTWTTLDNGNVQIAMSNGTGATSCSFRNGGFEGGINAFVVSTDDFETTTPASDYFTAEKVYSGNTFTLVKIADLPANAKIKHVGGSPALAWTVNGQDAYSRPEFIYTYGGVCEVEQIVTRVAVTTSSLYGQVGDNITISGQAYDQFDFEMDADFVYTFSPSSAGTLEGNVFTFLTTGEVTITATANEISNSIKIFGVSSTNLALNKSVVAGYTPGNADEHPSKVVDGLTNTEWTTWQKQPAEKEWLYVDLGGRYDIEGIDVLWGNDHSTNYILQVRTDAPDEDEKADDEKWTTVATVTTATRNSEIFSSVSAEKVQFVRIHSLSKINADLIRLKEMRVYGTEWHDDTDTENPVMVSAEFDSKTWNSVVLTVSATDEDGEIVAYRVVEANHSIDAHLAPTNDKITISGLSSAIAYNFKVSAIDGGDHESENSIYVEVTTKSNIPTIAAPTPSVSASLVMSLYGDTYDFAPASLVTYNAGWWNNPNMTEETVEGNHYLHYDLYRDGMIGAQFAPISVTSMTKLHIDIFSSAAGSLTFRLITNENPAVTTSKALSLEAYQWNSFDIDMTDFGEGHDWTTLYQFAIERYNAGGLVSEHISVDNIYLYNDSGSATAISNTEAEVKAVKMIENGQLVIIKNGVKYNVAGQQVK